jgi:hypothetical protein
MPESAGSQISHYWCLPESAVSQISHYWCLPHSAVSPVRCLHIGVYMEVIAFQTEPQLWMYLKAIGQSQNPGMQFS